MDGWHVTCSVYKGKVSVIKILERYKFGGCNDPSGEIERPDAQSE